MSKKTKKYEEKETELRKVLIDREEEETRKTTLLNEISKENEFLRSKLKFFEISVGVPRQSFGISKMTAQLNGGNFGMEDEAGEEFNNTYLLELKTGESYLPVDLHQGFSESEVHKRNSMYPQHLRTSDVFYNLNKNHVELETKVKTS
jgi:hypothetical protein